MLEMPGKQIVLFILAGSRDWRYWRSSLYCIWQGARTEVAGEVAYLGIEAETVDILEAVYFVYLGREHRLQIQEKQFILSLAGRYLRSKLSC